MEAEGRTVCPSTEVCSKLTPAEPLAHTMICILSYHRLVREPTCTPSPFIAYVPCSIVRATAAGVGGASSSRQSTKSAESISCSASALACRGGHGGHSHSQGEHSHGTYSHGKYSRGKHSHGKHSASGCGVGLVAAEQCAQLVPHGPLLRGEHAHTLLELQLQRGACARSTRAGEAMARTARARARAH